jgi:methylthioribulose-1-phosphate dehydratase
MYDINLFNQTADAISTVGSYLATRGWAPATSGNYSCRLNEQLVAITVSGKSKGELTRDDIMVVDLSAKAVGSNKKPSDEAMLHTSLYQHDAQIAAVLHTHSVYATVLSRYYASMGQMRLENYELLKVFSGNTTHDMEVLIPIFANSQDMQYLSAQVIDYLKHNPNIHGYLIVGHGLYTWGKSLADAKRHAEAWEFLFECELLHLKINGVLL